MITAKQLAEALRNDGNSDASSYVRIDDLSCACLDGYFDLEAVAAELNRVTMPANKYTQEQMNTVEKHCIAIANVLNDPIETE